MKIFFLILCIFFLVAWVKSDIPAIEDYSGRWTPEVIVTRDDGAEWPESCRPGAVAEHLIAFFKAFNRGDQKQLRSFFGTGFAWYSANQGSSDYGNHHFVTYNLENLFTYFEERHQQGERWELYAVQVGSPTIRGYVDIVYAIARFAKDLIGESEHGGIGKGAFDCDKQTIFVWSVGTRPQKEAFPIDGSKLCPSPPEKTFEDVVIACSR